MVNALPPFTQLDWTPDLAAVLADAVAALNRLDARIAVSSFASAWKLRASWTGYAAALRLQQAPLEEIDIIAEYCGLRVPGRSVPATAGRPYEAYPAWLEQIAQGAGYHWREDLPFTFAIPEGWDQAPTIARAFAVLDGWARADAGIVPRLGFPILLRRMGITACSLPCLVVGDAGLRTGRPARPVLLRRLLQQVRRSAEDGLSRLDGFEKATQHGAAVIAREHRPGNLLALGRLTLAHPCLAARSLAPLLGITVRGRASCSNAPHGSGS
jgi:hypothetical protein